MIAPGTGPEIYCNIRFATSSAAVVVVFYVSEMPFCVLDRGNASKLVSLAIMSRYLFWFTALLLAVLFTRLYACKKEQEQPPEHLTIWDPDRQGIPKFALFYTDASRMARVSLFRSSVGHDYSDFTETCRSMKHYVQPLDSTNWYTVPIWSPVKGKVTRFEQEWAGSKIEIAAAAYPAFRFVIFHLNAARAFQVGDVLSAGEYLGTHIGAQTYLDIAVIVNDPTQQGRMVSYIETLTDQSFESLVSGKAATREDFIISQAAREANPLECNGDQFLPGDVLPQWKDLR
jgi:hypothetical protein